MALWQTVRTLDFVDPYCTREDFNVYAFSLLQYIKRDYSTSIADTENRMKTDGKAFWSFISSKVDVLYTDFSKAFDKVNHNIMLINPESVGVHGNLLNLFESYT